MITASTENDFYQEFIMGRGKFDPKDFGVEMTRAKFTDKMVEFFGGTYRDSLTIDELLLHPVESLQFCTDVRRQLKAFHLPDDIILRAILSRRKNPS
jgi:hypothetical protein